MNPQQNVPLQTLPVDFDGTFRFTNWTTEDFTGKWGGKAYTFPAMKTTPMIILDANPYETQYIRKKFAKDLAEREFFKSKEYTRQAAMNNPDKMTGGLASMVGYQPSSLEALVEKCLKPLEVAPAPVPVSIPKAEVKTRVVKRLKSRQSGDDEDESLTAGQVPA